MIIKTKGLPVFGEFHEWMYLIGPSEYVELAGVVDPQTTSEHLVLTGLMIFSNAGKPASVGTLVMNRCRRHFLADLKSMGYTEVTLIGTRLTGMSAHQRAKSGDTGSPRKFVLTFYV